MEAHAEADRLIREGAKLTATGAPGAQEPLEQAVALAPEDPDILTRAASLSFDNAQFDRAQELLILASAHAGEGFDLSPVLAYLGGLLKARDGDRAAAVELLQAAFEAQPWQEGFGYQLAIQLLRAGRTVAAARVVERAIESEARDDDVERLRDHITAIEEAEAAYEEGSDPAAGVALAYALRIFASERSQEVFETILREGDDSQRALAAFNLGALNGERDAATAQRYYEAAVALDDPNFSAAAAFNLGGMLIAGDPVQARGMFERAAQSPDPEMAALARQQLAALS